MDMKTEILIDRIFKRMRQDMKAKVKLAFSEGREKFVIQELYTMARNIDLVNAVREHEKGNYAGI